MTTRGSLASLLAVVALTSGVLLGACGQDDDPEGARLLWDKINSGAGFRSWARAPGYATRRESFTLHAREVDIYVSKEMDDTLRTPLTATSTKLPNEWPVGSIVVKEGFSGGSMKLVAVMEKRADGWFWAEYFDTDGTAKFSGRPSVCIDCHDNRRSYSDWVYSFELPR